MKKKMKLSDLKVESFVTDLEQQQAQTAKGGNKGIPVSIPCTSIITITIISYFKCTVNDCDDNG